MSTFDYGASATTNQQPEPQRQPQVPGMPGSTEMGGGGRAQLAKLQALSFQAMIEFGQAGLRADAVGLAKAKSKLVQIKAAVAGMARPQQGVDLTPERRPRAEQGVDAITRQPQGGAAVAPRPR